MHSPHNGQILRPHCHTLHDISWVCGHVDGGVKKQNTSIICLVRQNLKNSGRVAECKKTLCATSNTGCHGKAWALEFCKAALSAVLCEGSVERTEAYVY